MKLAWKQIVIALLAGTFLGGLLTLRYCPLAQHRPWEHPEKFHQKMMDKFTSKLHLDASQQEKVSAILDDTRQKMDGLRKESRPKFEEIRNSSRARIRELLTAEQQKKFDEIEAQMKDRSKKWHE